MTIHVHEVKQMASGGSFVCIFDAEVEPTNDAVIEVSIESVNPSDSDPDLIEAARKAIQEGAVQVLEPRGQGAFIKVTRLVIHIIDFKESAFTRYTVRELEKLISNQSS
jgi:hypothetical protein